VRARFFRTDPRFNPLVLLQPSLSVCSKTRNASLPSPVPKNTDELAPDGLVRWLPGFYPDVGLSEEKEKDKVFKYAAFLRDFPIKKLLAATDMKQMVWSSPLPILRLSPIVLCRLLRSIKSLRTCAPRSARETTPSPVSSNSCRVRLVHSHRRADIVLVDAAVARDITTQLQSVLAARRPMSLDHQDFEKVFTSRQLIVSCIQLTLTPFSVLQRCGLWRSGHLRRATRAVSVRFFAHIHFTTFTV
jgi:hypothetical protein